jgi:hypothetical protein
MRSGVGSGEDPKPSKQKSGDKGKAIESPLLSSGMSPHGEQKNGSNPSPEKTRTSKIRTPEGGAPLLAGMLMPPAPPSSAERMVQAAHDEKVNATRKWVAGEMTTARHEKVHARANSIIKMHKGKKA